MQAVTPEMREFLNSLRPTDRRIAWMALGDYTQGQIAAVVGLHRNTIRTRLNKMRPFIIRFVQNAAAMSL